MIRSYFIHLNDVRDGSPFDGCEYSPYTISKRGKSIGFLQREHASTLTNLHAEIAKWQQKCSDLTFQLAIGGTVINSPDDSQLRATVERLEAELHQCQEKVKSLEKLLEEKEKLIQDYENRLVVNNRRHALELHTQYDKQRELRIELEHRATLIAHLTHQIHREKQHQQTLCSRIRLGQIILPNKPGKLKPSHDEQQQLFTSTRRLSNRSSSLTNRMNSDQELTKVLFIGRRPPTPPQQLQPLSPKNVEPNDEQWLTKRHRQLLNPHSGTLDFDHLTSVQSTNKFPTVLPPIINRKMPLKVFAATTTPQHEGEA